jgi:general secretion pathway protein I
MHNRKKNGFTLLEVLVAFTLLAATFATVMQIISGSAKNTMKASHNTKIAMLVQSKLDELGLIEKIEEGSTFGDFDEKTSWSLDIVPFDVVFEGEISQEFTAVELMEVTLQVTSEVGNKQTRKTFHTLRAVTPDASRAR